MVLLLHANPPETLPEVILGQSGLAESAPFVVLIEGEPFDQASLASPSEETSDNGPDCVA